MFVFHNEITNIKELNEQNERQKQFNNLSYTIIYNNSQNLNGGIKKELKPLLIDSSIESNIDGFCLSDVSSFEFGGNSDSEDDFIITDY